MKHHANLTRNRNDTIVRNLLAGTILHPQHFIQVLFVDENITNQAPVKNIAHFWVDAYASIIETIKQDIACGIKTFILFCVPKDKNNATEFTKSVILHIKSYFKSDIMLVCDLCLCNTLKDNHCGIINEEKMLVDTSLTASRLSQIALEFAIAGADCIAPSDMSDKRILAIRHALNENGFDNIQIMSYSTKFASNYYSAFRDIYKSHIEEKSPLQNRKTYQIDYRNKQDALLSSLRDETDGADMLMVKPIIRYLDIVVEIKNRVNLPICGFNVSLECVSLNLLAQNGYATLQDLFLEDWHAIRRSGVDIVISYCSRMVTKWAA